MFRSTKPNGSFAEKARALPAWAQEEERWIQLMHFPWTQNEMTT